MRSATPAQAGAAAGRASEAQRALEEEVKLLASDEAAARELEAQMGVVVDAAEYILVLLVDFVSTISHTAVS